MASTQGEQGYCKIPNDIMDALSRIRIPGEERQCLDFIIRKTYGWNKKCDAIAISQFHQATMIPKPHIIRALKSLQVKNLITVTNIGNATVAKKGNGILYVYEFNKDYDEWKPLPKKVTLPKMVTTVAKNGNEPLPILGTTKDTNTKDTTKDSAFLEFWNAYPARGVPPRKTGKEKALKIWKTMANGKSIPAIEALMACLGIEKQSDQWKNPKYIPLASTWLNSKPWKDLDEEDYIISSNVMEPFEDWDVIPTEDRVNARIIP